MITVTCLHKSYGARTILDGVDLTFVPGEITSLVGPSGGGKSTLLRCLNGLEEFQGGSIRVGEDTLVPGGARENRVALASLRRRVGMVFQQWNLFPHRTALGNITEAPVQVLKRSEREATERAEGLLARVGLSHRRDAYPAELSGGEQQRVAIARALAMEPVALLLDEPTSALDPERVGDVLTLLRALADDGLTMVLVTHEIAFARALSHRVVVLHGGKVIEDGTPAQVFGAPQHAQTRSFLGQKPGLDAAM
jgi:polar amino acid transport system ATP-binding protein